MAAVTLATLRSRARSRADMVNDTFVTDAEFNDFLNESAGGLYNLLVVKYEDYYLTESSLTFQGETATLPADFYKLLGVDVQEGGRWRPLHPYTWQQRNELRNATGSGCTTRYRLRGQRTLHFLPPFASSTAGKVTYIPQRPLLTSDADTVDFLMGWEKYVVLEAAIQALAKAERATGKLDEELAKVRAEVEAAAPQRTPTQVERVHDIHSAGHDPYNSREG